MATSFPSQIDVFSNPSGSDAQSSAPVLHSTQHANANDAIEALQAKVGIDNSEDPTSIDYILAHKVDQEAGKGLSSNDYTDTDKAKLGGIEAGANAYTHPAQHAPSIIAQDASNRFVTDDEKSAWSGKADLVGGKVPSAQLPSYVDDVIEATDFASLPSTGESGKIYVLDAPHTADGITSSQYRWSGSAYAPIVASPGTTDAVTEGSTNLYFTEARVRSVILTGLSLATNAAITATDSVLSSLGKLQKQITDLLSAKDATGGYAGLTLFKINFRNAANTFTSFFTNTNTAARTYTFQNKDGTIADLADVAMKQDASAALTDFVAAATGVGDAITDVPRNAELGTAAYVDIESVPQNVFPVLQSTARTLTIDDSGKTFVVSGTTTITLPLAADVFNASVPYNVAVKAITGATVTVARSGSDTIETVSGNKSMTANTGLVFFPVSATAWETI